MKTPIRLFTVDQIEQFWSAVDRSGDCWSRGEPTTGYAAFLGHPAHRVALWLIKGPPPPEKNQACHGPCHNRSCVRPSHLSWGSAKDNANDRARDGTLPAPRDPELSEMQKQWQYEDHISGLFLAPRASWLPKR